MKVVKGIEKTLKAKLDFVMDQATRLESSLMLPDEAVETANYRHWSVSDKVGNTHIFPIASREHFEKIDSIFDSDSVLVRQVRDTILAFPTDWMRLLVADDVLCQFTISRSTDRRTIFSFKLFQYAQKLTNYHDVVHQFKIARDRYTKRVARKKKLDEQQRSVENTMTPKQELDDVDEETESV
uniref:Uncharacterized protein n=1 Tax=Lutzomyia longipalpis TaxID=7200 RepID=A0A1B0CTW7_LUTLO